MGSTQSTWEWTNLHSSDAYLGLTMAHNNWVMDSTFIGESGNWGEPNIVKLRNGTTVMWHRSTPDFKSMGGHHHSHYIGLQLYDGAPHAEGTHFADFVDDDYKLAGAIGYRKPHAGMSPTIFLESSFDYEDEIGGNYALGRPSGEGRTILHKLSLHPTSTLGQHERLPASVFRTRW